MTEENEAVDRIDREILAAADGAIFVSKGNRQALTVGNSSTAEKVLSAFMKKDLTIIEDVPKQTGGPGGSGAGPGPGVRNRGFINVEPLFKAIDAAIRGGKWTAERAVDAAKWLFEKVGRVMVSPTVGLKTMVKAFGDGARKVFASVWRSFRSMFGGPGGDGPDGAPVEEKAPVPADEATAEAPATEKAPAKTPKAPKGLTPESMGEEWNRKAKSEADARRIMSELSDDFKEGDPSADEIKEQLAEIVKDHLPNEARADPIIDAIAAVKTKKELEAAVHVATRLLQTYDRSRGLGRISQAIRNNNIERFPPVAGENDPYWRETMQSLYDSLQDG